VTQDRYLWEEGQVGQARVSHQPEPDSGWDTYVGELEFRGWLAGDAMFYAGTRGSGWDSPFDDQVCEIEFDSQVLRAHVNVLKRNTGEGATEFYLVFNSELSAGCESLLDEVLTQ
jgi:hypothetical protein